MIVYMLVNEITEKVYIGQTQKTLALRIAEHFDAAKIGSSAPLHVAMRETPQRELWTGVVLQVCYEPEQLDVVEKAWIELTCSRDGAVGYNAREGGGRYNDTWKNPNAAVSRELMSPEQIQFYRECGKKGGRRKEDMTPEEREKYREWGRKGAERSRLSKLSRA